MTALKKYGHSELLAFLRDVDRALSSEETMVIIGGASMAIAYQGQRITSDVDTYGAISAELERALAEVNRTRPERIPVSSAGIAQLPYEYESRLVRVLEDELANLMVFVLERHDLALSKVVRWHEGDEVHVLELHAHEPLDLDLLVGRFLSEMNHLMGDARRMRLNMIEMVALLFGELAAERVARQM